MSSRNIVLLGLCILLLVFVGAVTVGDTLAFYVAMSVFFIVMAAILTIIIRRRKDHNRHV